jgi:hypothetical protein
MVELTRSQHSVRATDFLFETPIFKAPDFVAGSAIPKPTATRILALLRGEGTHSDDPRRKRAPTGDFRLSRVTQHRGGTRDILRLTHAVFSGFRLTKSRL